MPKEATAQWYTTDDFRRIVWTIAAVILIGSFINGVLKKDNDYLNHYKLGRGFLAGKPYMIPDEKPFCPHYAPGRLALNAAFAVLPYRLSRAVWWTVSIVVLIASLLIWDRMAPGRKAMTARASFAAAAFSLVLVLRWLLRDLDDCGQQLLLLGILTAAGWAAFNQRPLATGALLALGATYKVTPMLFLPLLLYKRRWREAVWMVVFVVGLNVVAPALRLGLPLTWQASQLFLSRSAEVTQAIREDPSANGVEDAKHTNKNLRLAIARYLQTYPPGHPLFIPDPKDVEPDGTTKPNAKPHPLFVQFLDLPARTAGIITTGVLLMIAIVLAVRYRRPWHGPQFQEDFAAEWASVTALCALMSPLCWGQHLVLFIPAVYLSVRAGFQGHSRGRTIALWIAALLILAPQRELIGRDLWWVVQSYKPETVAAVIILALVLILPKARVSRSCEEQALSGHESMSLANAAAPWAHTQTETR